MEVVSVLNAVNRQI